MDKNNVFEFKVTKSRNYFSAIYLPILLLLIIIFIFSFSTTKNNIISMLIFVVLSPPLWILIAEKYTFGRIKITTDNEGMYFEWPKQIPFEKIEPIRILFTEITYYDYLEGGRFHCPGFRFFEYPFREFFEVNVPIFTTLKKKSSYSDFRNFLKLKSTELTNEGVLKALSDGIK